MGLFYKHIPHKCCTTVILRLFIYVIYVYIQNTISYGISKMAAVSKIWYNHTNSTVGSPSRSSTENICQEDVHVVYAIIRQDPEV